MSQFSLRTIFGDKEIGDVVKDFNFDQNELRIPFAPLYGPLNGQTVRKLSDEVQILIAGMVRTIAKMSPEDRNYDSVTREFSQSPLAEKDNGRSSTRSDTLRMNASEFKSSGAPDASTVQKIHSWFAALVNDDEVLRTLGVGADDLAKMASNGSGKNEKTFETTFLNFPDPAEPYFKVQRVKLVAFNKADATGLFQSDLAGIRGDYQVSVFQPRNEVLRSLSENARNKALSMRDEMFQ